MLICLPSFATHTAELSCNFNGFADQHFFVAVGEYDGAVNFTSRFYTNTGDFDIVDWYYKDADCKIDHKKMDYECNNEIPNSWRSNFTIKKVGNFRRVTYFEQDLSTNRYIINIVQDIPLTDCKVNY